MGQVSDDLLPKSLDDIDSGFMTRALRASGAISPTNEVVSQTESGVGMTAGYYSAIKKITCVFKEATDAPTHYVAKAWPQFELLPKEAIAAMFKKDIEVYLHPPEKFYPRPKAHLAAFDAPTDRWVLLMEDADAFAEHKVHEDELTFDEVMQMIPRLVEVAVIWEGADKGEKAAELEAMGVDYWASEANLAVYKAQMPGGVKIFDKLTTMGHSALIGHPAWDVALGGAGICEMFAKKVGAYFAAAHPVNGATCTLSHGDLRGDNIWFVKDNPAYPDGWLCIDFQLMFQGPVPSDLAYLMGSGSVLPSAYSGDGLRRIMTAFYDQFMARTQAYPDYSFEKFVAEYAMMTAVCFTYYAGMGVAYYQNGAHGNTMGMQIELGGKGATEADLAPEDLRRRMWWGKAFKNFRSNFATFGHYQHLASLPESLHGLGPWTELPAHLK